MQRIIRMAELPSIVGLHQAAIYMQVREGTFPKPVQLGKRATGWRSGDIEDWMKTRPDSELSPCGKHAQVEE